MEERVLQDLDQLAQKGGKPPLPQTRAGKVLVPKRVKRRIDRIGGIGDLQTRHTLSNRRKRRA